MKKNCKLCPGQQRLGLGLETANSTVECPCAQTSFLDSRFPTNQQFLAIEGIQSKCDNQKPLPSVQTGNSYYTTMYFNNTTGETKCVRINLDGNQAIGVAAYLNSYDPTNLATNYIGSAETFAPIDFSVNVPNNQTLILVIYTTHTIFPLYEYLLIVTGIPIICPQHCSLIGSINHNNPTNTTRIAALPPNTCNTPIVPITIISPLESYDVITIKNTNSHTGCITCTYTTESPTHILTTAYAGSFDPNNITENYLGSSSLAGNGAASAFSFLLPASVDLVLVTTAIGVQQFVPKYNVTLIGITCKDPCLHPNTLVQTSNKGMCKISDLRAGDSVIDHNGKVVNILYNIETKSEVNDFVMVSQNALGVCKPLIDLYIRDQHPILYQGKEINPLDLANKLKLPNKIKDVKLEKYVHIYSLCTKEKTFVMMNNIPVATWGDSEWQKYANKNKIRWTKL